MLENEANLELTAWLKILIVLFLMIVSGMVMTSDMVSDYSSANIQGGISNVVNTPAVQPSQDMTSKETEPTSSKSWHETESFSGENSKTTDSFYIRGDKFKLTYDVDGDPDYSMFSFFIYPEGETTMYTDTMIGNLGISGKDSTISHAGEGSYYLEITTANLDDWEIIIEDYY